MGSAIVVAALVYVMISTRGIPERTEELAYVLGALYGVNQLRRLGATIARARRAKQ